MIQDKEKKFEQDGKTLNIFLPFGSMPLLMKIITLLTSAGGLSMVASMFADIVRPQGVSFHFYLLRSITGMLMLSVGYGIAKRKEWSLWLYGGVSVISLFINPILSILPIGITIYLYTQRAYFTDKFSKKIVAKISVAYKSLRGKNS